jgi:hypothetical protein
MDAGKWQPYYQHKGGVCMRAIKTVSAIAMVLLGFTSCSDTPTKEVEHNAVVTLKVLGRGIGADSLVMEDNKGIAFSVDSAFVHVSSLLLALPSGVSAQSVIALNSTNARLQADSNGVRVVGPFIFNLLSGQATPPLQPLTLPPGEYQQLSVVLDERDDGYGAVDGEFLFGRTLLLDANFTDADSTDWLFELYFGMDQTVIALSSVAIALHDGDRRALVARFGLDKWLAREDIVYCQTYGGRSSPDGQLTIDDNEADGACDGTDESIKSAIGGSCSLVFE